jgi:hypothetical protein
VSLELTLSLDFLNICEDASYNKLHGSKKSYFLDLQIKIYGCLMFLREVWARRACVGANEVELTKYKKVWGKEGEGKGVGVAIMGDLRGHGQWPPTMP